MASKKKQKFVDLGKRLKAARLELKLTQAQVAEKSGVNVNYYARLERGEENVSFDHLDEIAKVLNIEVFPLL